jgi:cephalosporin hydroxylase
LVVGVDLPDGRWGGIGVPAADLRDRNLIEKWPHFRPVRGDSHDFETVTAVENVLAGTLVDFLFIDGDHSLQGVWTDFDLYKRFVRPGGLIGFHDIIDTERHRNDGVEVPKFWNALEGRKVVFNDNQGWGGIGVLYV